MSVTAIFVLEFIICGGWISLSNAQPSASIFPQEHQSVCRGQYIFYNCIGNGTGMDLYSPPIVNESQALQVVSSDPVRTCPVVQDSAAAIIFGDSSGSSSIMATFALFISNEQSEGQRRVYCSVIRDGMAVTTSATFSVLGAPNLNNIQILPEVVPLNYSDDLALEAVNISWDSPVNAEEFTLRISNTTFGYTNTICSFENRVTVWLPFGTYLANLCVINRCGRVCQDFPSELRVERQQGAGVSRDVDHALLAAAIVAGVLGVFFILAVIYGVVVTIKLIKK